MIIAILIVLGIPLALIAVCLCWPRRDSLPDYKGGSDVG